MIIADLHCSELIADLEEEFPGGSEGKASAYNAGDRGSIPGLPLPSPYKKLENFTKKCTYFSLTKVFVCVD